MKAETEHVALRYARPLVAATVLCMSMVGTGQAQRVPPRTGLWLNGGIGVGFGASHCNVCGGGREGGMAAGVAFGGTFTPRLAVGLQGVGWMADEGAVDLYFGTVALVARWYPDPAGRLHMSAGPGIALYRADEDGDPGTVITSQSFGLLAGIGYDLHLSDRIAITPQFDFAASVAANLKSEGEDLTGVSHSLIRLGVGLSFR